MINSILAPAQFDTAERYRLSPRDLQSIRAKADSAIMSAEIAQMRQAFIEVHGDEFGTDFLSETKS